MEGAKKVVVDTNLLVRYLTDDDPHRAKAVDRLLDREAEGEIRIVIPAVVIAELVWVMESFYRMEAGKIGELAGAILYTPGTKVTEKAVSGASVKTYMTRKVDLVDAWIMEFALHRDIMTIYIFDREHFRVQEGIETESP